MPGYSWMFSGKAAQPNVDARDLVAYVRSLGERSLAGESGGEQVDHGMAMEMSSSYGAQGVPDTRTRITAMGLDPSAPIVRRNYPPRLPPNSSLGCSAGGTDPSRGPLHTSRRSSTFDPLRASTVTVLSPQHIPEDFADLTRSLHVRATRSLSLDEPDVDAARQDEKRGAAGEVNSIVDKPSTPVSFFQKIFCMPLPSK